MHWLKEFGRSAEVLPQPSSRCFLRDMHMSGFHASFNTYSVCLSLFYFLFARESWKSSLFWMVTMPTMHTLGKVWLPSGISMMMDFQVSVFSLASGLCSSFSTKIRLSFEDKCREGWSLTIKHKETNIYCSQRISWFNLNNFPYYKSFYYKWFWHSIESVRTFHEGNSWLPSETAEIDPSHNFSSQRLFFGIALIVNVVNKVLLFTLKYPHLLK